ISVMLELFHYKDQISLTKFETLCDDIGFGEFFGNNDIVKKQKIYEKIYRSFLEHSLSLMKWITTETTCGGNFWIGLLRLWVDMNTTQQPRQEHDQHHSIITNTEQTPFVEMDFFMLVIDNIVT
ncbi:hypothetical protein RFI_33543, partial [Reticulomyxa filosa]